MTYDHWDAGEHFGAGVAEHAGNLNQAGALGRTPRFLALSSIVRRPSSLALSLIRSFALALLLFEHLSIPLPLSDLQIPRLYEQIAAEPGDFALLELPLGWRNGARVLGKQDLLIMQQLWYQTGHGKRLLGGNTSRNPEYKFQYFGEQPTLARLIALTNAADLDQHTALRTALGSEPIQESDRDAAQAWAGFMNLRYALVHRDKLPPVTEDALRQLLPVTLVAEDGALALYRIADLPRPQDFVPGSGAGRMVLGEGWSPPVGGEGEPAVWAQRRETRLMLPLPASEARLSISGWSPLPGQTVAIQVDGVDVGAQPLGTQPHQLTFEVPADAQRPPLSDVWVRFSALAETPALAGGPWPVGETGASSPVSILVRSAGKETGDFAHIYVNGREASPDERGYNLVALDAPDGAILGRASFDTHLEPGAGAELAAWIDALPAGAIVAGSVRDEASAHLDAPAVDALRTLGLEGDLREHFRWGHAFVGVKGAAPGAALEATAGSLPAQVALGLPVSAEQVAAAITHIRITQ